MTLPVHKSLSNLHFFKVGEMLLKYENLILPAGCTLDLYCVQLSSTALFCENDAKLYFDAKHLEKGMNKEGGKVIGVLFSKKCPFWPISNVALNF